MGLPCPPPSPATDDKKSTSEGTGEIASLASLSYCGTPPAVCHPPDDLKRSSSFRYQTDHCTGLLQ